MRHGSEDGRAVVAKKGGHVDGAGDGEGVGSEGVGLADGMETGVVVDWDERDRERWAKLKRLKQAFHVKRRKGRGDEGTRGAEGKV